MSKLYGHWGLGIGVNVTKRDAALVLYASLVFVACASALLSHALIGAIPGLSDYADHEHGSLGPALLASLLAAGLAIVVYVDGIIAAGRYSLLSLAHAVLRRLDLRALAIAVVASCVLLACMEFAEQAAAGRFDGVLSPYGDMPAAGIAVIALVSTILFDVSRRFCAWLAAADATIRLVVLSLLTLPIVAPHCWHVRRNHLARANRLPQWYARGRGSRAPPALLAMI